MVERHGMGFQHGYFIMQFKPKSSLNKIQKKTKEILR